MKHSHEILSQRTLGQYPVSIATSLALEGAAGIYPEKEVPKAPIVEHKTQLVMINILTLYRNIVESVDQEDRFKLHPLAIIDCIIEEITILHTTVDRISKGVSGLIPYTIDYSLIPKVYPHALLKMPSTPKQLKVAKQKEEFLKVLFKKKHKWPIDVRQFLELEIKGKYPNTLIITHCLTDLFSRYAFTKLELLESHTGVIKPFTQWNTKLTNGKNLTHIPFCKFTLQVFGDNNHQFVAHSTKLKKVILELAEKDHWTAVTTIDKIKVSLNKIDDQELKELALRLI